MAGNFPDCFGQHQVTGTGAELGGLVAVSAVDVRQRVAQTFGEIIHPVELGIKHADSGEAAVYKGSSERRDE